MARKPTTVRLDETDAELLEQAARVDGVSQNEFIRQAILDRIAARKADPEFQDELRKAIELQPAGAGAAGRIVTSYLGLDDFVDRPRLYLAWPARGRPSDRRDGPPRSRRIRVARAAGGLGGRVLPRPDTKAGVLLVHLTKNHPLPDGNKRAAYLAMIQFLPATGGSSWPPT